MPTTPDIAPVREATVARALVNRTEISAAEAATREGKLKAKVLEVREKQRQEPRGALDAWHVESMIVIPDGSKAKGVITEQVTDLGKQDVALQADEVLRRIFIGDKVELLGKMSLTQAPLIDSLRKVMHEIPEYKAIAEEIDATTNATGNNISGEEWIRFVVDQLDAGRKSGDNRFIDKLRENYAALIDKDRTEILSTTAAQAKVERKTAEVKNLGAQFLKNTKQIEANDQRILEFEDIVNPGAGKDLAEVTAKVKNNQPAHLVEKGELDKLIAQKEKLRAEYELARGTADKNAIRGQIKILDSSIENQEKVVKPYEDDIKIKERLTAEYKNLHTENENLYTEQDRVEHRTEEARRQQNAAEAALSNAAGGKKEDVGAQLQGLVGEAFKETMIARDAAERQGIIDTFDAQIKTETDPDVRAGLKVLKTRYTDWEDKRDWKNWKKGFGLGRTEKKVYDKKRIDRDLDILVSDGKEGFVEAILSGQIDPSTINASTGLGMIYSPDKIAELVQNKDFMDKIGAKSMGILLRQAQHEGLLTEAKIDQLQSQDWWEEAFDEFIKADDSLANKIDAEMKKDPESQGESRFAWLKKKKNLGILAVLFALTGGGVGLPLIFAGYQTLTAKSHAA